MKVYKVITNKLLCNSFIEKKIKHLTCYNSNLVPYCEKFEILEESTNSCLFTTATTPVRKINFEYKRLKEILVNDEMINKHLKDHVQSIRVYEFEHEMDINLTKFIYGWRDAYPKCQKYSLSFLRCDEKEIKSLLQLCEMNIRKLGNIFIM